MTSKPHLLVVSHSPGLSGAERSLLETLHLLAPTYELHLVIPGRGKLMERAMREDAPPLASLHQVKFFFDYAHADAAWWRKTYWRMRNWIAHRRIVFIARRLKVEAVYSNSVASWQGAECARALDLPHVWHLRELILASSIGFPLRGRLAQTRHLAKSDTMFLSNSNYVADWYEAEFGITPRVGYQPVAISDAPAAHKGSDLLILGVGRLHSEKRHDLAIKAISLLPKKLRQRVRLEIFGEGPERRALQDMIDEENLSDSICLKGYSDTLPQKVAQADIMLATSVGEPFGRATAEALMIGCPVIGVESGGTAELLGDENERGILIAADDAEALANAIVSLADDPETAMCRAKTASAWARTILNSKRYRDTVCAAIDDAISIKKGRDDSGSI